MCSWLLSDRVDEAEQVLRLWLDHGGDPWIEGYFTGRPVWASLVNDNRCALVDRLLRDQVVHPAMMLPYIVSTEMAEVVVRYGPFTRGQMGRVCRRVRSDYFLDDTLKKRIV